MERIFLLPTKGAPWTLTLHIEGEGQVSLKGFDKATPQNIYFDRSKMLRGKRRAVVLQINMPISPARLVLSVRAGARVKVMPKLIPMLPCQKVEIDDYTAHFIDHAVEFALQAHRLAPNQVYSDEFGEYPIEFTQQLRDRAGNEISGPAKVQRATGYITISRPEFIRFTIFSRIFVLLHEWFHHHANTGDEQEVDERALQVYLSLGFPKLEVMNATAGYFEDKDGLIERSKRLLAYLREYQQNPTCNKGRKCV